MYSAFLNDLVSAGCDKIWNEKILTFIAETETIMPL